MGHAPEIPSGRRVAVIDIGTNTLLLLVAEVTADGMLRSLCDTCRFGRLGQGLDGSGILVADAIERSLAILREYRGTMDELGVEDLAVVGTQALREARNSAAFVEPAADILGVPVETIAGEREAELVYRAVAGSFPSLVDESFVVADVGGGSTEIIVVSKGRVESFVSVPLGSVRMTERHLHSDPPAPGEVEALIADIDSVLDQLVLPTGVCVVGTAGTATSMASVALALRTYDAERVQGFTLSPEAVDRQLMRYLSLPVVERMALPGLEPQRADLIAAGVAIFARLLHRVQGTRFLVSDHGVRWGLAIELAAQPAPSAGRR